MLLAQLQSIKSGDEAIIMGGPLLGLDHDKTLTLSCYSASQKYRDLIIWQFEVYYFGLYLGSWECSFDTVIDEAVWVQIDGDV